MKDDDIIQKKINDECRTTERLVANIRLLVAVAEVQLAVFAHANHQIPIAFVVMPYSEKIKQGLCLPETSYRNLKLV